MTDVRPSVYETAGSREAFIKLATALTKRCLEDPVLNHPFSHMSDPQHVEHLASYFGEVFGGPAIYSQTLGGHSAMLTMHASTGAEEGMAHRFANCFIVAMDDANIPNDPELRRVMSDYIKWAVSDVDAYSPMGSVVPEALPLPRWSWDGPVAT
jgi:hemoglobin